MFFEQQSQQSKVSKASQSNSHSGETSIAENEAQDSKYNFRALLRKTGQDLTSGSTLSRNHTNLEAKQIDFRNVLRKNAATKTNNVEIDKMKLMERLIAKKIAN